MAGVALAISPPLHNIEKGIYISACVVFAVIGIKLTIQQSNETARAEAEYRQKLEEINFDITGADTIPYVVPQTHDATDVVPLFMWAQGTHLLNGVTYTMWKIDEKNGITRFPELDVGVLHSKFGRPLKTDINPRPGKNGEDLYFIDMYTQSQFYTETLKFRRSNGKNTPLWAYQYFVSQQLSGEDAIDVAKRRGLRLPKYFNRTMTISLPVIETKGWSDDLISARSQSGK